MKTQSLTLLLFISYVCVTFSQSPIKLSTGEYGFIEGPVWDRTDKIYFSDIGKRKVYTYSSSTNSFSTAFNVPSPARTNGLMFNSELDLIVCDFRDGTLTRRQVDGTILETYTDVLTNPNDLCVDNKDGIYVTSPGDFDNNRTQEIYYISSETPHIATLLDNTLQFPNGIIITNNGKELLVTDSGSYDIYKFDINPTTGLISNKKVFATLENLDTSDTNSRADGMALDTNGNLYVAAKKSIQVFNVSGNHIKTYNFEENPTNCTFGGPNLNTLFVTTPNDLYKIDLPEVTGFQHPFDLPTANLSIEDLKLNNTIKLYPNPIINNEVTIAVGHSKVKEINLYNTLGQHIKSCNFTVQSKNIVVTFDSHLKKDTYILSLRTSEGASTNSKIVIQ